MEVRSSTPPPDAPLSPTPTFARPACRTLGTTLLVRTMPACEGLPASSVSGTPPRSLLRSEATMRLRHLITQPPSSQGAVQQLLQAPPGTAGICGRLGARLPRFPTANAGQAAAGCAGLGASFDKAPQRSLPPSGGESERRERPARPAPYEVPAAFFPSSFRALRITARDGSRQSISPPAGREWP